ncbi:GrdX family protein [Caloranaerobacter azorensis]|uniref:GrdX protein n=2 Tax=Caloranaerobacter azorensis TaxID=116090 RepID=A0A096BHR3_9FIRM|nr:GrdX family protein [Caloranaerobacter azorensis]KGG80308.1 GrdX protein [Caloranaerobacter azorensis H53214]QIB26425.1 GrdX protein [Caloranaerobacter azorensis]
MGKILITNNPLVKEQLSRYIVIEYYETEYLDILKRVRDKIHLGHKLLSHPLSGSVKPNETPYKSIIISKDKGKLDYESLMVIEKSIETAEKFLRNFKTPNWTENILLDFQIIDLSLIKDVVIDRSII